MIRARILGSMAESFEVEAGGARFAGEIVGDDALPVVVFLHAGVADRRMWGGEMAAVSAAAYRGVTYDRRGFGETKCEPDAPFSHVDDLAAVLDHLGVASALALVGSSQGGRIALDFALAHPGRVDALVLVAPAVSGAPPPDDGDLPGEALELLERLERAEEAGDLDQVNALEARLWLDGPASPAGRVGDAGLRDLFLSMNGIALNAPPLTQEWEPPSAYERLGEVTAPALVLWGDRDFPHLAARCAHLVANLSGGAEGHCLTDTAHLPNLERPDAFRAWLLGFLERHRP